MRCSEVQGMIVSVALNAAAREHLLSCTQCQAYARDSESLETGLALLAQDTLPEPSWGFAARVLRRLDEAPERIWEPFEAIGRRVVILASALAMTVVVVLALSSSGPLRSGGQQTFSWTRADATYSAETLLAGGVDENEDVNLLPVSANGGDSR